MNEKFIPSDTIPGVPQEAISGEINNEEKVFKIGDLVEVQNSNGAFDEGWKYMATIGDKIVVGKEVDGQVGTKQVSKDRVRSEK